MSYHFNPIHVLRGLQAFLALITLALFASVSSYIDRHADTAEEGAPTSTPSSLAYPVFTSTMTLLLVLPYLVVAPRYFPNLAHKYAMFGIESTTMILWLAAWISPAAYLGKLDICRGTICHSARAGVVFATIEWLLFVGTAVFAGRYCLDAPKTSIDNDQHEGGTPIKGLNISRPIPMSSSNGTGTPMPGFGAAMGGGQWPGKDDTMV